jgi:hypothetical protein
MKDRGKEAERGMDGQTQTETVTDRQRDRKMQGTFDISSSKLINNNFKFSAS